MILSSGKCRVTGDKLREAFSLGVHSVNGFVKKEDVNSLDKFELKLGIGPSGLVQLWHTYDPAKMYGQYWYDSSVNPKMKRDLADIANRGSHFVNLKPDDYILDIGGNSGELMSNFGEAYNRVVVDPSSVAKESNIYNTTNIELINNYFDTTTYKHADKKHKLVFSVAMFYDLENPIKFCKEVKNILADDGVFVLQLSYFPFTVATYELGNISEEHLCYYRFKDILQILYKADLDVLHYEFNYVNGGSIRLYISHLESNRPKYEQAIQVYLVDNLYNQEKQTSSEELCEKFILGIDKAKQETIAFLENCKAKGKKVLGYGASTKGNVLLQYFGITPDLLPAIAEVYKPKIGLYTAGTGIPIISEEEMRSQRPDYLLVLPWHFVDFFIQKEAEILQQGTRFVTPLPKLKIM